MDEAVDESFPASDPPAVHEGGNGSRHARGTPVRRRGRRRAGRAKPTKVTLDGAEFELDHGAVAIAAITSCTNTSNPSVMLGAALLAKKAVERGL